VNPDEKTFAYLKGRPYAPKGAAWDAAVERWKSFASDADAEYDDVVIFDAEDIEPTVTWGISPDMSIGINGTVPSPEDAPDAETRKARITALEYMQLQAGQPLKGMTINVVFIGSCTNGRLEDLMAAAEVLKDKKVAPFVKLIVTPASRKVFTDAVANGTMDILIKAGAMVTHPGCGLCCGRAGGILTDGERVVATNNRNFLGRMGTSKVEIFLASPKTAAASAVAGKIVGL
jgi:3-isopropylmalate/(R)-2-methylmalate dehydratase large subunit